mgnify:CR=1 FL=1
MKKLYAFGSKKSLDLSLSENPLGCSPRVSSTFRKLKINFNDYPKVNGNDLKKALSQKLSINENLFFIANGSESIINMIPRILCKPNDEVIIPELTFPMFQTCSELAGLKTKIIKMNKNLEIDLNGILKGITNRTKLIFICNPNNPTGNVLSKKRLISFLDKVPKKVLILLDEANIEFAGETLVNEVSKRNNLVILRTFSKGFGLANLRVGFAVAPAPIINKLEEEINVFPVSGLSENLAISALSDDLFINKTKEFIKEVQIDTDFEILFPDNYINSITERLNLYNELSTLETDEEIQQYEQRLVDRFGELPIQAIDLLDSVRLKWFAKKLGLEKVVLKQKRMIGYFIADQQSAFYQTEAFTNILKYIQQNPTTSVMKEKQTKSGLRLLITFIKINSVETALERLKKVADIS